MTHSPESFEQFIIDACALHGLRTLSIGYHQANETAFHHEAFFNVYIHLYEEDAKLTDNVTCFSGSGPTIDSCIVAALTEWSEKRTEVEHRRIEAEDKHHDNLVDMRDALDEIEGIDPDYAREDRDERRSLREEDGE